MIRPHFTFTASLLLAAALLAVTPVSGSGMSQTPSEKPTGSRQALDPAIRADFIAGLRGDSAAFDRAMKASEDLIAANPEHAEAMVWHGSGLLSRAGQAFQTGDFETGATLWSRGLEEMDAAVALDPENVSVLVPRGGTLLAASRHFPDPGVSKALFEKGVGDYEKALEVLGPSPVAGQVQVRGRVLLGLADGWSRRGDAARSRRYYERTIAECKDSEFEKTAARALATMPTETAGGGR